MDSSTPQSPDPLTEEQKGQLRLFRQADVVALDRQVWLAHGDIPTTAYSREHAAAGKLSGMYESTPLGHAILTQTCDLVPRPGRDRPFVAVGPLVRLGGSDAAEAARGRRPRYAHVPAYHDGSFFVDLDRITTIETGLLLTCHRTAGVSSDEEQMVFARALARKFGRFAFPDDLPASMAKWRDHVVSKHDKEQSAEGTLYRYALDVRVAAEPHWGAESLRVTVTVLLPPGFLPTPDPEAVVEVGDIERLSALSAADIAKDLCDGSTEPHGALMCERLQRLWSERCHPVGVVESVDFELLGAEDMTVDAYLNSYSFDLEFLSPQ